MVDKAKEVKEESAKVEELVEALQLVEPSDYYKAVKEVEDLRAGRNFQDIPLSDPYWKVADKFRLDYNK